MAKKAYIGLENFPVRKLPPGYTQVEYIEFTGAQCIDTWYIPKESTEAYFDNQYTSLSSVNGGYYAWNGATGTNRFHMALAISVKAYHVGIRENWKNLGTVDTDRHTLYMNADTCVFKVDDAEYAIEKIGSMSNIGSFLIGGGLTGNLVNVFAKQKTYGLRFMENGVTVCDYVPCINPDGEAGLYDVVGNTFHGNAGTGTILTGAVINGTARKVKKAYFGVPDNSYTGIEYIECNGTQYIDNIATASPTDTIEWETSVRWTDISTRTIMGMATATCCLWGVRDGLYEYAGWDQVPIVPSTTDFDKVVWKYDPVTVAQELYVNDVFGASKSASFAGMQPISLGHAPNFGTSLAAYAQFAYTKVKVNGELVCDMIPRIDQDGVVGMYDRVNDVFRGSNGSGAFIAGASTGEIVTSPSLARRIKKAYVGDNNGIARLWYVGNSYFVPADAARLITADGKIFCVRGDE